MKIVLYRLTCLDTWSPGGGTVWEDGDLLEVCHRMVFEVYSLVILPVLPLCFKNVISHFPVTMPCLT